MYPTQANDVAEHMLLAGVTPSRQIYLSLMRIWLVSRRPGKLRCYSPTTITDSLYYYY